MEAEVKEKVEKFLAGVRQIPTLPDVYLKVKKAFDDSSVSVDYIADAIRFDQSLTVSILRLANSPLYGFRQKISSINQAVMLIGLREIYSLVLSVSVMGLFPTEKDKSEEYFPSKHFWEHSLGVALTSRLLGITVGFPHPEDLFVAGLIHDIGKIIEKIYMPAEFEKVCLRAQKEKRLFIDIEREEFGFTHCEVGQLLAEKWLFPEFLTQLTAHHHDPLKIPDEKMSLGVSLVHMADCLVKGMGLGWSGDPYVANVEKETLKQLHLLPFDDLASITAKVRHEFDDVVQTMVN